MFSKLACFHRLGAARYHECDEGQLCVLAAAISPPQSCLHSPQQQVFDAKADGYVRGEACITMLLETSAPANPKQQPLLVLGCATNSDARSSSLTAPNGPAQQNVVQQALASAVHAGYVVRGLSTHGTGTSLGDPIEVQGALGILSEQPLTLLASKSYMGHAEPAAGVVGLTTAAEVLWQAGVRSVLHLHTLNPYVAAAVGTRAVHIPRQCSVPVIQAPNTAFGVSAFAFQGSLWMNMCCWVHVLSTQPPNHHRIQRTCNHFFIYPHITYKAKS